MSKERSDVAVKPFMAIVSTLGRSSRYLPQPQSPVRLIALIKTGGGAIKEILSA